MKKFKLSTSLAVTLVMMTSLVPVTSFADTTAAQATLADQTDPYAAVNNATTAAQMLNALVAIQYDLNIDGFTWVDNGFKSRVAGYVLVNRKQPFTSLDGIRQAVQAGVNEINDRSQDYANVYPDFKEGEGPQNVSSDLSLRATTDRGVAITWSSDNPSIIDSTGHVVRPTAGDANVVLTGTLSYDSETLTRSITVTVLQAGAVYLSPLEQANQAQTVDELRKAVENPDLNVYVWEYEYQSEDVKQKAFEYMLAHRPSNGWVDAWSVTVALETAIDNVKPIAIDVQFSWGDSADHVTQDLFLDTMTADGYEVSWTTDRPDIIDVNRYLGRINRPFYQDGNATVTLTATTARGSKTFVVTVLAKETSALQDINSATNSYMLTNALFNNGNIGLDTSAYLALPYPLTNQAGDYLYQSRPSTGFASLADVQVALNAAVAKVQGRDVELASVQPIYATGDKETAITQNLTLPTTTSKGTPIKWTSTKPSIIDPATGKVTRPASTDRDAFVVLSAVLDFGSNQTLSKSIFVTVLKQDSKTVQLLNAINSASTSSDLRTLVVDPALNLTLANFNGLSQQEQTDALATMIQYRPTAGFQTVQDVQGALTQSVNYIAAINSINIQFGEDSQHVTNLSVDSFTSRGNGYVTWTSDHPEIFDAVQRSLHRPSYTTGPVTIHLKGTLEFGFTTYTKTYELTVDPLPPTDQEATQFVANQLTLPQVTTENLTLPSEGQFGTTITWSTSNAQAIEADGTVHRAHPTVGDQTATLTAHVTRNGVTQDHAFDVTVKAYEYTPLDESSITVVNNKHPHAEDSVTVSNTQAGDEIKVYAEDGVTLIAQATATDPTTTLTFANLGHKHTTIYVSNTRAGYVENKVMKFFPSDNINHPNL
ncbi:hypothetical protein JJB07_07990 [Tumebacillus sp. ITR2]|uniref:Atrophied bacterial Ig domain-containing protein n=1 Tax=Tumebacillus amylolyticus TaxID=2801339 RepID=A0ABS1J8I2_9BACL|nr:immunoglobulin-like domain-containing protein [Tumebacillus amylolyticus]MBL0386588.1 hypothetical protein [Tumebacillus amylolyticus]